MCSGSIDAADASPQAAAEREILEETKLSSLDVSPLIRGKPFSLIDEGLKTEWTIHPFAFQLRDGASDIDFDWEHTEFKFVRPEDLSQYDHVPQLEIGMQRVMVGPETREALAILRNDNVSGAQALAVKALQLLLDMARGGELAALQTSREYWKELRWRAWHLAKNGKPAMASAIESALFKSLDAINRELTVPGSNGVDDFPLANIKGLVESVSKCTIADLELGLAPLAKEFSRYLERNSAIGTAENSCQAVKIVTLSASDTIQRCLVSLLEDFESRGIKIQLTVLESRPNFEGVSLVNKLLNAIHEYRGAKNMLSISIVPDASVASAVIDADYVIFGADKVLPNGDVSNKIGSCSAAVVAKATSPRCKVVALFDTEKITGSKLSEERERNDENEVVGAWPGKYPDELRQNRARGFEIEVRNDYFERVPAQFIDEYITEQGLLSVEEIERLGGESAAMEKRLFGDL